jgi:hypothetical protein
VQFDRNFIDRDRKAQESFLMTPCCSATLTAIRPHPTPSARPFDPEILTIMREVLDDAWGRLSPELQALVPKSVLAERILKSAAKGERDRERLLDAALRFAA